MATLRSFQSEIDEIHQKEITKQRALNRIETENAQVPTKYPISPTSPTAKFSRRRRLVSKHSAEDIEELQVPLKTVCQL